MMSGGEFLEDEIQAAVFGLGGDKALGPNGFPIAFIQQFRDLIKDELIQFVKEFHDNGKIAGALGASFIVLIPKKEEPISTRDFRLKSLIWGVPTKSQLRC